MKSTICSDCKRSRAVEDDVSMAICLCGNTLNFNSKPILSNNNSKDNQILLKQAFERGRAEGRSETIEEMLNLIDTKIKVNLR